MRDSFKLNSELNNDIKNNGSNLRQKQTKKILKPSINNNILESMKKSKNIKNKNRKIGFGDSYEFNFTFNNYNSNFTYNTLTEAEKLLKDNNKADKIIIDNLSNRTFINKFKVINPSTIRNDVLGRIKKILNKNNDKKLMTQDNQENLRKTKDNQNYFAIKIQKIFRGYLYRKKNRLNYNNKKDNKIAYNIGIYIHIRIFY